MSKMLEEFDQWQANLEKKRYENTPIKIHYVTKKEIAIFWYAMGELCEFRGVFAEEVPTEGWARKLSRLTVNQLRMAYIWYEYEGGDFPPDLVRFLQWARKDKLPPKKAETLLEYEARRQREIKVKVEHKPNRKIGKKCIKEMRKIVNS